MSTHNVRGMASGEYECSCGCKWDRDEGDECPLGRVEGKKLAHDNEMMEHTRIAALNGTLQEPKEVASAGDDRKKFETRFNLRNLSKGQDEDGDIFYFDDWVQGAWIGWQARGESNA